MSLTYIQVFKSSIHFFHTRYGNISISNLAQDLAKCEGNLTLFDILGIILVILILIKSRVLTENYIFMPLCDYTQSNVKSRSRVCESGWKALFHATATLTAARILFRQNCQICFHDISSIWKDYSWTGSVPFDIRIHYYIQIGYYLYGFYAVICVETRKKDSSLLLIHHLITLFLLFGSYYIRAHKFVPLTTFLHDFNDIFLELAKFFFHLREQNGKINIMFKRSTEIFGMFVPITWFITRIYYFPLTGLYGLLFSPNIAIVTVFAFFLWIILLMDVFWFTWIVLTYYRVITGQVKEITDVTSYDKNQ